MPKITSKSSINLEPYEPNVKIPESDSSHLIENLKPGQKVWFAKDGDKIVGGVKISLESGATGKDIIGENVGLDTLLIESSERRKGYGRAVLIATEAWVNQQAGLPKVISLAVETDNDAAIGLYISQGYETLLKNNTPVLINSNTPGKKCFIMYKHLVQSNDGV